MTHPVLLGFLCGALLWPFSAQASLDGWVSLLGPKDRLGVEGAFGFDGGHLSGEQWINQFRNDESFDYGSFVPGASGYLLFRPAPHWKVGPEARFLGNYGTSSGNAFGFGWLTELSVVGEYSLHGFEKVDAILGARAGLAVLFPAGSFADEIRRLQSQGVHVWGGPHPGMFVGLNVGARRPLVGALYARADLFGELEELFLFSDDETVAGLHFRKYWNATALRLGLTLGLELTF